jgi:hypothetical protein
MRQTTEGPAERPGEGVRTGDSAAMAPPRFPAPSRWRRVRTVVRWMEHVCVIMGLAFIILGAWLKLEELAG